jgi:hypothetical protein
MPIPYAMVASAGDIQFFPEWVSDTLIDSSGIKERAMQKFKG